MPLEAEVAIIGGGAAGLYAGMILESLGITFRIYEIQDKVGGRINTYEFPGPHGQATHPYFDVGAMRFPKTEVMKRLFDLVERDDLFDTDGQLLKQKLVDYHFSAQNCDDQNKGGIYYFHGVRAWENDLKTGELEEEQVERLAKGFGIDKAFIKLGYMALYHDIADTFVSRLRKDLATNSRDGWAALMDYDNWSTRSYLSNAYLPSNDIRHELLCHGYKTPLGRGLPTNVVDWLETMLGTSGFYDTGLAAMVTGAVAFGFRTKGEEKANNPEKAKFYCFDGGSQVLTRAMKHYIDTKKPGCFFLKRRVTAIAQDGAPTGEKEHENLQTLYNNSGRHGEQPKQPKALKVISVNANGDNAIEHRYSHVICTVPITCLRYSIDHSGCELSDTQKNAIRQVQYTPAVKVGVKFKSAWWTFKEPGNYPQIGIIGGQSFTDLPIRTVVYPSYGISGDRNLVRNLATLEGGARTAAITSIKTKASRPAVLIASYVRTNDAATFGSLIPPHPGPVGAGKTEVKDLVLRNLADIHNVELAFLQERYLDLYAYDFSENNRSMGAFASFGPGKFGELYTSLTVPAARGRLHFAGDTVSIRHGWVVGAFDSAWRTVCEYLLQIKDDNQVLLKKFLNEWGVAKVWAARALDTRNSHLPSESILTKNQVYFTAAKKGVLENAANAATAENARIAAEALRRATAKANQERDAMAQLALTSAKAKADIAIEKRDAAVAAWRAVADQARVGLVLAEAVAAGALVRSIQAISAYNPLVQAGDRLVPLVLVGGRNPGDWARLANIAAAAAHTALAANGANGQTNVNAGVVDAMKAARSLAYA